MDVLIEHLFFIYRAVFELNVYHNKWLTSTTLVLRKPGKPAYNIPNAYSPIGLLDTLGKLLSTLVAADLTFLVEKHELLPSNQFGGRPGRNTTDAIHMLTHTVKNTWRSGKVAAALFLDIQGAFPNTCKDQLIHNMKARRIPSCYIKLISNMLTNRKTSIVFDDFTSDPIDIDNSRLPIVDDLLCLLQRSSHTHSYCFKQNGPWLCGRLYVPCSCPYSPRSSPNTKGYDGTQEWQA